MKKLAAAYGYAAVLFIALATVTTPALAEREAANNGASTRGTVSVGVIAAATCTYTSCIVDGGDIITPMSVSAEDGVVYAY